MDKEICITKGEALSSDGQTVPHWDVARNTERTKVRESE